MAHPGDIALRSGRGRGILVATVLASGMAFLDGTVVNVALPTIGRELGATVAGLQWIVTAYLLTLSAFVLLGGSLGDVLGRKRVFIAGTLAFAATSAACGAAPSLTGLWLARALQGVAAALLVPGSLAILKNCFRPEDQDRTMLALSRNEAVPLATMRAGMPWDWVTFPEFLDSVERTPKGVNMMTFVPLAPLYGYVAGILQAVAALT